MEETQAGYLQILGDINTKLRDLEDKQKILKSRIILIGENLIETREETNNKIIEIKKDIELIKRNIEKMLSFFETASGEFSKFAKKEDVEILAKQAKMFQPLALLKNKV